MSTATAHLVAAEPVEAAAGAAPYLTSVRHGRRRLADGRQALAAERRRSAAGSDRAFLDAKRATARFYAEHFLAPAPGCLAAITGGRTVLDFDIEQL